MSAWSWDSAVPSEEPPSPGPWWGKRGGPGWEAWFCNLCRRFEGGDHKKCTKHTANKTYYLEKARENGGYSPFGPIPKQLLSDPKIDTENTSTDTENTSTGLSSSSATENLSLQNISNRLTHIEVQLSEISTQMERMQNNAGSGSGDPWAEHWNNGPPDFR